MGDWRQKGKNVLNRVVLKCVVIFSCDYARHSINKCLHNCHVSMLIFRLNQVACTLPPNCSRWNLIRFSKVNSYFLSYLGKTAVIPFLLTEGAVLFPPSPFHFLILLFQVQRSALRAANIKSLSWNE